MTVVSPREGETGGERVTEEKEKDRRRTGGGEMRESKQKKRGFNA